MCLALLEAPRLLAAKDFALIDCHTAVAFGWAKASDISLDNGFNHLRHNVANVLHPLDEDNSLPLYLDFE